MSVVANVAINVDSREAVTKLRQVEQASSKLDQTYQDLNGRLRDANGRFIKAGEAAQAATGKIDILGNAVENLVSQLVAADLARRFFKGFDEAEKAAAALRTLGVDSKALEGQLLNVSNRLGGLYSQTQLLTAAYDVASSGFANAADNAKILEASAKGATAGLSDINTVGNAVTSVLNAYGKSAAEAGMLVDGFIQTQNDGKIVLNEYAQQIGTLAPTAAAAGVGIQELNAAVATITAQGVPVESTFTGLNQSLVAILKPSKEASDLAQALGIDFNEAGLRAKGFGGLLQEVKEKTGGSTTALVQLFGSVDALKVILPLVNDDLVKYNQNVQKQADVSGIADKATQELGGTVSAEVSKMINQIGNLTRSLDTVLGPALGGIARLINVVIAEATRGINVLGQLFSLGKNTTILKGALESGNLRGSAAARVIPGVDELIGQQRRQQLQRQAGAGTGFLGLGFNAQKFAELLKQQPEIKRLLGAGAAPAAGGAAPAGVDPAIQAVLDGLGESGSKGRKGATDAEKAAEKAAREAERLAQLSKEQLNTAQQSYVLAEAGLAVSAAVTDNEKLQAEYDKQRAERMFKYSELLKNALSDKEREFIVVTQEYEVKKAQLELNENLYDVALKQSELLNQQTPLATIQQEIELLAAKIQGKEQEYLLQKQINELISQGVSPEDAQGVVLTIKDLEKQNKVIQDQKQLWADIYTTVSGELQNALTGLIDGTAKWGDVLSSILGSLGNLFLNAAFSGLGGALKLPGFAEGGFVTGPTTAMIGEGGEPEYVIPASKMRSAMGRYAGGARGASVIPGNGESGGGGMGAAPSGTIDVRYSIERINNVDYVTADQFQRGMAQAAQQGAIQGERRAMRSLKNSAATRRGVGI